MRRVFKQRLSITLWPKVAWAVLVWIGVSQKWTGLLLAALAIFLGAKTLRSGLREQFWVSPHDQAARLWEDLVWSHSTWKNPGETPQQGIERLAGPHQRAARRSRELPEVTKRQRIRLSRQHIPITRPPCRYCPKGVAQCDGHGVRQEQ